MNRRTLLVLVTALLVTAPVGAQFWKRDTAVKFKPFRANNGRFSIDYPDRDWNVLPGGSAVVSFAQRRGEASVSVEHASLQLALERDEIGDLFARLELDDFRTRHPELSQSTAEVRDVGPYRVVVISAARAGALGDERLLQYSFPVGTSMYRVTCVAATATYEKYEPVFLQMIGSFRTPAA